MKPLRSVPSDWRCPIILRAIQQDEEPREYAYELEFSKEVLHWGVLYKVDSPMRGVALLKRTDKGFQVDLSVNAKVTIPCSRCLEPTPLAIFGDLRYLLLLHPPVEEESDGEGVQEEEMVLLEPGISEVDLAPYFWETFIVSLPPTALCQEQCAGLCAQCGVNKNKTSCTCQVDFCDPRLEALREVQVQEREDK